METGKSAVGHDDSAAIDANSSAAFPDLDVILASTSQIKKPSTSEATTTMPTSALATGKSQHQLTSGPKILAKIAPKPPAATSTVTIVPAAQGTVSGGQFVIFQKQNGKAQQIRLAPSVAGAAAGSSGFVHTTNATSFPGPTPVSGNIQLIKSADGASFIQLKPSTAAVTTTAGAIGTNATCLVLKNSAGQRVVLGSGAAGVSNMKLNSGAPIASTTAVPATGATHSSAAATTSMPRTLTVAQAQKMGLLSAAKLKELVTAAKAQKQAKQAQQQQTQTMMLSKITAASTLAINSKSEVVTAPVSVMATASGVAGVSNMKVNTVAPIASTTATISAPSRASLVSIAPKLTTSILTTTSAINSAGNAGNAVADTSSNISPVAVVPAATANIAPKATSASTPPTINQKITIQTSDGSKKHVLLPPNLYKMAQQGQIKAVNITGKGVQYLRINASNASAVVSAPSITVSASKVSANTLLKDNNDVNVVAELSKVCTTEVLGASPAVATTETSFNGKVLSKASVMKPKIPGNFAGDLNIVGPSEKSTKTPDMLDVSGPLKRKSVEVMGIQEISRQQTAQKLQNKSVKSEIVTSTTPNTTAMVLNRTIKMEETIDPDTLLRRSSLSVGDGTHRRSIGAGGALNQSAGASSVVTYSFGSPRKYAKGSAGATAGSVDSVTATMVDSSSSFYSLSSKGGGGGGGGGGTASESEPDGPRRKHCNCTKSQCLKLYCDCFANGEFCKDCNCKDCFNNIDFEEERQKAIKICLERNPQAFKPKIGKGKDTSDSALRRHNKGCNCKRSGCLKNYCECYEAKIACSANCKCVDCHNMDEFGRLNSTGGDISFGSEHHHHTANHVGNASGTGSGIVSSVRGGRVSSQHLSEQQQLEMQRRQRSESPDIPSKKPCNFMTQDVIEATIQCVIAQAEECEKNSLDSKTSEKLILEEFGRCLVEIIEFSLKNPENE